MISVGACALSDVGRARRFNEDFFAVDHDRRLYLVADGMGGHGNGEVASRLVVNAVRDDFDRGRRRRGLLSRTRDEDHRKRMREAIDRANQKVLGAVERDASLVGMGTTLVALLIDGRQAILAHVGDSRAYRLRDDTLVRLTDDHTWVNEQLSAGNLSESQARNHPFKSVVTRALGGDDAVEAEVQELEVEPGDLYLLCSDGLTTMLSDEEIRHHLRAATASTLEASCQSLVRAANERGGRDNVTVLLLALSRAPGAAG